MDVCFIGIAFLLYLLLFQAEGVELSAPSSLGPSISDQLGAFAANEVVNFGLLGVFLLLVCESAGIPIPSATTLLFAGYGVSQGEFDFLAVLIVGTVANVFGASIGYALGYYGRFQLFERRGLAFYRFGPRSSIERWFAGWGVLAVFASRMLPVARVFSSLPAGAARMPYRLFVLATFFGSLAWVVVLTLLGVVAAKSWDRWVSHFEYVNYGVLGTLVVGAALGAARVLRDRRATKPSEQHS
jgi:membrane protein DedA with SNARE-associated domain